MELTDKIAAVSRMQKYILENIDDDITLEDLSVAAGYSKFHAARIFKEASEMTPFEYIRAIRLTRAAEILRDTDAKITDVALDSGFDSHDGFTRAFSSRFNVTPNKYRREAAAIGWFVPYDVEAYYSMKEGLEMEKGKISRVVTVTAVERPARKLILLRAKNTLDGDYLEFCEEMGCDWEGLLNSVPEKFDSSALLTLPSRFVKNGTSNTAAGVEVPADYCKPIPGGYDIIDLPPCTMLYFNGASYGDENDFCEAIGIATEAVHNYDPTQFEYKNADEVAPFFNFGASAATGARLAKPVERI